MRRVAFALDSTPKTQLSEFLNSKTKMQSARSLIRYPSRPTRPSLYRRGSRFRRTGTMSRFRLYRSPTEVKSFDVSIANSAAQGPTWLAAAAAEPAAAFVGISEVNDVQAGTALYQRVGSRINIRSIALDFDITPSAATVIGDIRWALVYDRQTNGAFPAITDMFGQNGATGATYAGVNMGNRNRFSVIRDQVVCIDPGTGLEKHVKVFCKGYWPVDFKASGGAVTDFTTGAIFFVAGTEQVGGAGTIAFQNIQCRCRYYDQ